MKHSATKNHYQAACVRCGRVIDRDIKIRRPVCLGCKRKKN